MKKGKQKSPLAVIVILCVLSALLFGCAKPAPTPVPAKPTPAVSAPTATAAPAKPAQTAAPAPTTAPKPTAPPAKPIEIRVATAFAQNTYSSVTVAAWGEEIEKRSAGRLKPIMYWGEALGKATTMADLLLAGGAEAAVICWSYTPGRFPLLEVLDLPLSWPSGDVASRVYVDLYNKGYFDKELEKYKLLFLGSLSPYNLASTTPIRTPDGLKGKKIRSGGGPWTSVIQRWGAVPISMPAFESYSALEKKIIDGSILSAGSADSFKLYEVVKNFNLIRLGGFAASLNMNLDFYKSLPANLQKIVDETFVYMKEANLGKNYDNGDVKALETFEKSGVAIYTPTPAEMEQWKVQAKATIDTWIEDQEKKGLPSRKLINDMVTISSQYGAKPY